MLIATWLVVLAPILTVFLMLWSVPEDELPSLTQLENPRSNEARIVYDIEGEILGIYYMIIPFETQFYANKLSLNYTNSHESE